METIPLYVGYDPRESVAYHVFCQSVIEQTSVPVAIHPLHQTQLQTDGQRDGTNAFIYSRYLVPHLRGYEGWAIFCDGDMVLLDDLLNLWDLRDDQYAVMVVKHDYKTRHPKKYIKNRHLEARNIDYPRKNWSSVMLINCGHPSNKILTKRFIEESDGATLHRFKWLNDYEIGSIPSEWNHLVGEYDYRDDAKLVHYTLGVPGFEYYVRCDYHESWNESLLSATRIQGERPEEIVRRAAWRRRLAA